MMRCRDLFWLTCTALNACATSNIAGDPSDIWTTSRLDSIQPGTGVHWDWQNLGDDSAWGWQSFEKVAPDGGRTGVWTTFPPRDFAVQMLGADIIRACEKQFVQGATACSVDAEGVGITLGSDGAVCMRFVPETFAKHIRSTARVNSTSVVDGEIASWREVGEIESR